MFKNENAAQKIENNIIPKEESNLLEDDKHENTQNLSHVDLPVKKEISQIIIEKREALKHRQLTQDDLVKCPHDDHTYAISLTSFNVTNPDYYNFNDDDDDTGDIDRILFKGS